MLILALLLGGCIHSDVTKGDFGRLKPILVNDDTHSWVGREAARDAGYRPSRATLTDDERELRDLAYQLIEPPYNRERFDSVLLEYGIARNAERSYSYHLLTRPYRSPVGRYSQMIEDIRNDNTRLASFVPVARRVLDMDNKRRRSLGYVSGLTAGELDNARRRIAENALVIAWVHRALRSRTYDYRYALERMVIDAPSPMAVEAERTLTLLRQRIAEAKLG
jgi:hypothetical protein